MCAGRYAFLSGVGTRLKESRLRQKFFLGLALHEVGKIFGCSNGESHVSLSVRLTLSSVVHVGDCIASGYPVAIKKSCMYGHNLI